MKVDISKLLLAFLVCSFIWLCGYLVGRIKTEDNFKQRDAINSVEFKATFKNYEIVDKYHNDTNYFIVLLNSYTKKETIVEIKDYEYYNIYFVGDIIE